MYVVYCAMHACSLLLNYHVIVFLFFKGGVGGFKIISRGNLNNIWVKPVRATKEHLDATRPLKHRPTQLSMFKILDPFLK